MKILSGITNSETGVTNHDYKVLLLNEVDCVKPSTLSNKCRGHLFNVFLVPIKMEEIFEKSETFGLIKPSLKPEGKIIYY